MVSDIPAEDGKMVNLFYCESSLPAQPPAVPGSLLCPCPFVLSSICPCLFVISSMSLALWSRG
jgi:hypothetical protein